MPGEGGHKQRNRVAGLKVERNSLAVLLVWSHHARSRGSVCRSGRGGAWALHAGHVCKGTEFISKALAWLRPAKIHGLVFELHFLS